MQHAYSAAAFVVIGTLLLPSAALCAEWGLDANAGFSHDDNLTNAFDLRDKRADTAATGALAVGIYEQLGAGTSLGVGLVADGRSYFEFDGLDNLGLGVKAQLRWKFGLGAEAPWIAFAGRAAHRDYRDDLRDGWDYDASVTVGRMLSPRWSVRASLRYDAYVADRIASTGVPGVSTAAYDVDGWTIGGGAELRVTDGDTLAASLSWRDGSVTAVTTPNFAVLSKSDSTVIDRTFSNGGLMAAYGVDAKTWTGGLVWSHALGRSASVNLSYAYRSARAAQGLGTYVSNIFGVVFGYSY
jgi:hypothetical protein